MLLQLFVKLMMDNETYLLLSTCRNLKSAEKFILAIIILFFLGGMEKERCK